MHNSPTISVPAKNLTVSHIVPILNCPPLSERDSTHCHLPHLLSYVDLYFTSFFLICLLLIQYGRLVSDSPAQILK